MSTTTLTTPAPSFDARTRRFRGHAYRWVRPADRLPTYPELTDDDPLCKVKLFGGADWCLYIAALTPYDDGAQMVATGFGGSPCPEWGDTSLNELAASGFPCGIGSLRLPAERDLHYQPMRLSEIRAQFAEGNRP